MPVLVNDPILGYNQSYKNMDQIDVKTPNLKIATFIAYLLDSKFELFGRKFGFNGILGLIPGIGDLIPAILSLYLVFVGFQHGLPVVKILHMLWNILFNFLIGLIPIIGDYKDFFSHYNLNNLKILEDHIKSFSKDFDRQAESGMG